MNPGVNKVREEVLYFWYLTIMETNRKYLRTGGSRVVGTDIIPCYGPLYPYTGQGGGGSGPQGLERGTQTPPHTVHAHMISGQSEGVYPLSAGGLPTVGIDASKGFIALWVHLFVAMEGIHRNGYRWKRYFLDFD